MSGRLEFVLACASALVAIACLVVLACALPQCRPGRPGVAVGGMLVAGCEAPDAWVRKMVNDPSGRL